jgi:hypothetical protein
MQDKEKEKTQRAKVDDLGGFNHQQAGEGPPMTGRKWPSVVVWIIPLLTAFAGFYRVAQSPSLAMYRAVDIVQLLGSGVCFGAAMAGAMGSLLRRR